MHRDLFLAHGRVEDRHWWFTGRRTILRALLHAVLPAGEGSALVDVGCGTGGNIGAFASDYSALALDPSADAVALARERFPRVRFIQTENPEMARDHLARGGALMMTDVLEHVQDDHDLFRRALAVLPSGSHLMLTVPAGPELWSSHDDEFGHVRRYRLEEFRALWSGAPVDVRLSSPFNARLYPIIRLVRRLGRGRPARPGGDLSAPAGPFNGLLRRTFAGEARALVQALDRGTAPFGRGVSLVAVLRRR
jgi:SAM-dependent methyltransferase